MMTSLSSRFIGRFALCAALGLSFTHAGAQTTSNPALEKELGAEVARFVEGDRIAPPAPCQVLFVGSSSIVKWKDTLATDMAPMRVINRGFGGSHVEYVNLWFDQIVPPYRPRRSSSTQARTTLMPASPWKGSSPISTNS